jgi:predicted TIM-barrel fold metal-dependent hydrolase
MKHHFTRREFLASSSLALLGAAVSGCATVERAGQPEPIIDIHQHTGYSGRTNEQLIAHQQAMGVTQTIMLPAGREVSRPSTHNGKSNGLAAKAGGNQSCLELARQYPGKFFFCANEVPDLPEAKEEVRKYLKLGALGVAEQKFHVECDSPAIEALAEVAREFRVPMLLHFQHDTYNMHLENFHKTLEKFPKVNFIGHAQTWWGNIDAKCDPKVMYPKGKVTPGGLTDRLLADYPNMYGDLSAGSGLNAMTRDEEFTRGFMDRHQNKLLFGSDCSDAFGQGTGCSGAQMIATVRRLAPSKKIERKLLCENARKMFRL